MGRTISSVLESSTMPYAYESLVAGQTIATATSAAPARPVTILARNLEPIALSETETRVTLGPTGAKPPKIIGAAARRNVLVVGALRAELQPGTLYRLELQVDSDWTTVGFVHFFNSVAHGEMDHEHAGGTPGGPDRVFTFDVTRLTAGKASVPGVRIRPVNSPVAAARTVIGRLELVAG
jgi:hypothetical protein